MNNWKEEDILKDLQSSDITPEVNKKAKDDLDLFDSDLEEEEEEEERTEGQLSLKS